MRFVFCLMVFLAIAGKSFSREAKVVSGEVEFVEADGTFSVVQTSPTAMIEWEEFSIESGEIFEFLLPSEEASVSNCIDGSSQIEGVLKSNGCLSLTHSQGCLKNSGRIEAAQVEIQATGGGSCPFAITQNGIIQAKGKVLLDAQEGKIEINGVITAAAVECKKGGEIEVLGESIFLRKGSELDASGDWGGGKILVGIDDREERKASFVLVEEGATARADARIDGQGGTVIFFAEKENLFLGGATVQGGCMGGDGGLVEITSPGSIRYLGRVSLLAPFGKPGTFVKDKSEQL